MADFKLGRIKFKWRGNWAASTSYLIDDVVKYGGNSYVAIANHTSPANVAQIAVGRINKSYKNNTSDLYQQYFFEDGDATFFVDSDGYFVKRENRSRGATALSSDDFSTAEANTYPVVATTWSS